MNIDLSSQLHDQILVEIEGFAFLVEIEYERFPLFYSNCKTIGHSIGNCKKIIINVPDSNKDPVNMMYKPRKPVTKFVPKNKEVQISDVIVVNKDNSVVVDKAGASGINSFIEVDFVPSTPVVNNSGNLQQFPLDQYPFLVQTLDQYPLLGFIRAKMPMILRLRFLERMFKIMCNM